MTRIFISHSSLDNFEAIAFRDWLVSEGWSTEEIFLDLYGIGAGARWKEALAKANERCEAVILLLSPYSLASRECYVEIRMAEDYGKAILPAILPARAPNDVLEMSDERLVIHKERQIVDLSIEPRERIFTVEHEGQLRAITFNRSTLVRIKTRLDRLGISPKRFSWAPGNLETASPYPGLRAFDTSEAALYFGRSSDISRCISDLRKLRQRALNSGFGSILVVQAASGAGKSSFLKAGLWPRLERDADFVPLALLRPATGVLTGDNGIGRTFASFFAPHGKNKSAASIHQSMRSNFEDASVALIALINESTEIGHINRCVVNQDTLPPTVVIAVDQAEELFGIEHDEESARFLSLISVLINVQRSQIFATPLVSPPIFIWTIRADGMDSLLHASNKAGLAPPVLFPLPPIRQTDYREIIEQPLTIANQAGMSLNIDSNLTDLLVKNSDGADALPILAYTLSQLVEDSRIGARANLSLEAYESLGGFQSILTRRLAAAQRSTNASEEHLRQLIIPHLATWDEEANPPAVKRLVASEVLLFEDGRKELKSLADALVEQRLLSRDHRGRSGGTTLEVAHEALLRQVPLSSWLEEDRSFLLWRNRLRQARRLFANDERGFLFGRELEIAHSWLNSRPGDILPEDRDFISDSSATAELLIVEHRATAWKDVASRISHEIKNPLVPIQLSAERLKRKFGAMIQIDRKIFDRCVDTIIRHVEDIGRMVDEFGSFARMPKPVFESADVIQLAREVMIIFQLSGWNIEFGVEAPAVPLAAVFDKRLITQSLINLVKNSCDAIESRRSVEGLEGYHGEIKICVSTDNASAVISVLDNGIGLPGENRSRFVEPYVTTKQKGSGLGLAIAARIMEQHRGQLTLEDAMPPSSERFVTVVRLVFPLERRPER